MYEGWFDLAGQHLAGGALSRRPKPAGVDAYNHNLNTSEPRYSAIANTHIYEDALAEPAVGRRPEVPVRHRGAETELAPSV